MTRLDATAVAVLVSLAREGRPSDLLRRLDDPESAAVAERLTGAAAGLPAAMRAGFLFDLAGEILREEMQWVER